MAFIDLEELKQDAEDEGIVQHPLKDVLSASKKAAYVKGIVFAGFVDDDKLQNDEEKFARARALSLDMPEVDFKEALADVKSLSPEARSAFLKEVLGEFKDDRAASFYFVSDLALAMASDGDLTPDAVNFLESVYSLLRLSDADCNFLSEYRVFLAPGRMAEAGALVHRVTQEHFDLPDGFVRFFTPDLNPITLKTGECLSHVLNICSAEFQLEGELIIPKTTTLVMKDAEIRFGRAGKLTLSGSKIEIRNCRFVVPSKTAEGSDQSATHFICGKDLASLELSGCTFDGAMERGAVATDGTLIIKECVFCNLKSEEPTVSAKEQFTCTLSEFKNCQCTKHAIISVNQNVSVTICRFERCKACSWLDMKKDYPSDFNVRNNLFDRCYASCDFCYVTEKTTAEHALYRCCFQEVEYKVLSTGYGYGSYRFARAEDITRDEFEKIFNNKGVADKN